MDVILGSVKMQVVGATRLKMTPQSKILFTNYSIGVQPSEHFDQLAVKEVVVMPGYLIRMDKDRDIREAIVVIDDVALVGMARTPFCSPAVLYAVYLVHLVPRRGTRATTTYICVSPDRVRRLPR